MMEDFRDTQFNPAFVRMMVESRKPEGERDGTLLGNARADITKCFERIERELEGKEYLAGSFSLADIAYMANFDLLDRFQISLEPRFKNSIAWMNRLKARPSFAASGT
jgi:glutathione S-transferase